VGVVLFLLLLVVPIAELYVIVKVAGGIGVLNTLALLILVSIAGAWLVKWQGVATIARFQRRLMSGQLPTAELVDGILIITAGALLLTPGFLTDALGILLLVPPVRIVVRSALVRRYRTHPPKVRARFVRFGGDVIDVDGGPGAPRPPRGPGGPDAAPPRRELDR
jgi:UPF0716 protein FxsA